MPERFVASWNLPGEIVVKDINDFILECRMERKSGIVEHRTHEVHIAPDGYWTEMKKEK